MSWEREYHHLNLDEGEYRIGLVEKNVQNRHGEPARHLIQIHIGAGAFEYQVGANHVRIKLGGDFTIKPDGSLQDSKGNVFDPHDFEKKLTRELNNHHNLLRTFARKHNAPELKPKGNLLGKTHTHDGAARPARGVEAGKGAEPAGQHQLPGPAGLRP